MSIYTQITTGKIFKVDGNKFFYNRHKYVTFKESFKAAP